MFIHLCLHQPLQEDQMAICDDQTRPSLSLSIWFGDLDVFHTIECPPRDFALLNTLYSNSWCSAVLVHPLLNSNSCCSALLTHPLLSCSLTINNTSVVDARHCSPWHAAIEQRISSESSCLWVESCAQSRPIKRYCLRGCNWLLCVRGGRVLLVIKAKSCLVVTDVNSSEKTKRWM